MAEGEISFRKFGIIVKAKKNEGGHLKVSLEKVEQIDKDEKVKTVLFFKSEDKVLTVDDERKPKFIEKFRAVANSEKMRQDASAKSGSVYKDRLAWLGPEKIWMSDLIKRNALIKQEPEGNIRYQQTQIKICDKYRHSCL